MSSPNRVIILLAWHPSLNVHPQWVLWAGTSPTYVLCRSGHISAGFSASGNAGRFPDYLPFVSILFCALLQIARGQLWGLTPFPLLLQQPLPRATWYFHRVYYYISPTLSRVLHLQWKRWFGRVLK